MRLFNRELTKKDLRYIIIKTIEFSFFIAMILYTRKLIEECPLCAYQIATQYGNVLPKEEQLRIMKSCLDTYYNRQYVSNISFNLTLPE